MTEVLAVPSPHGSHRHSAAGASRGRLLVVLALVVGYLLVEVIGSLLTNSLALLADAGHMLTDAVGVGLALLAIAFSSRPATASKSYGYYRLEILVLPRTWSLLREAVDVLLQATPRGVNLDEVRAHLLRAEGVADAHDLHAWSLTSGMNVVSAHVIMEPDADPARVLDEICACLSDDFDMEHSTIQLETTDRRLEEVSHP